MVWQRMHRQGEDQIRRQALAQMMADRPPPALPNTSPLRAHLRASGMVAGPAMDETLRREQTVALVRASFIVYFNLRTPFNVICIYILSWGNRVVILGRE